MIGCIGALAQVPLCWMHCFQLLMASTAMWLFQATRTSHVVSIEFGADPDVQHLGDILHGSSLTSQGNHKKQNFFQFASWCVAMVEGSLVEHQLFSVPKG